MISTKLISFTVTLLICNPLLAMESSTCGQTVAHPLTSVADFDANGIVNGKDIAALAKNIGSGKRLTLDEINKYIIGKG